MADQQEINRISASFYRQLFLSRMLKYEQDIFMKIAKHSGIKQAMLRMKNGYENGLLQIKAYLGTESSTTVDQIMKESDEKIRAIHVILEKLAVMSEADVLELENQFEVINVKY